MTTFLENLIKPLVKSKFMLKKNNKTIKERIVLISKDFSIPEEAQGRFLSAIMELIERAKSPNLFCSKCDSRMSIDLDTRFLQCFNCGAEKRIEQAIYPDTIPASRGTSGTVFPKQPESADPNNKVVKALDAMEKREAKKTSIQDLANSRGGVKVTKEDEDYVKSNIPGAKNSNINWS